MIYAGEERSDRVDGGVQRKPKIEPFPFLEYSTSQQHHQAAQQEMESAGERYERAGFSFSAKLNAHFVQNRADLEVAALLYRRRTWHRREAHRGLSRRNEIVQIRQKVNDETITIIRTIIISIIEGEEEEGAAAVVIARVVVVDAPLPKSGSGGKKSPFRRNATKRDI